jgi:hypothetical protein
MGLFPQQSWHNAWLQLGTKFVVSGQLLLSWKIS